jgi:DNA topoisomerase I
MGKFLACSGYPECKNTKPMVEDEHGNVQIAQQETTDEVCPTCGAPMRVKSGKRGRFLACSKYPECKTTQPFKIGVKCTQPGCGGEMVERRSARGITFYSCNRYPDCKFSLFERPRKEYCEKCEQARDFIGEGDRKKVLCCEREECRYDRLVKTDESV